jgi:hypothetical protein
MIKLKNVVSLGKFDVLVKLLVSQMEQLNQLQQE